MLTGFAATNNRGDQMVFDLSDVSAGYEVQNISGLDPVKATLVTSSVSSIDGVQYQSSHREARDIQITLGLGSLDGSVSVKTLRRQLYNFFMSQVEVQLDFLDDEDPTVRIFGRVESCEQALFTDEPTMVVSVMCFNPDFFDPTPVVVSGFTASDTTEMTIDYEGTVDTGIRFQMEVDRDISEFTIYHKLPNNELRLLEFAAPLATDDLLLISTIPGAKGATVAHGTGAAESILYGISPYSAWIALEPGENKFRVFAEGDPIPFNLEYTNKYGGL